MGKYDSAPAMYIGATALAGMAAVVIPYARPITFLMGLMGGDSPEMERAAAQWNDKSPVHIQPLASPASLFLKPGAKPDPKPAEVRPPMIDPVQAAGGDIALLRQEMGRLVREIGNNKQWVGTSYDTFVKTFNEFDTNLALFESRRKGVGGSLDVAAEVYFWGAVVCQGIATVLAGLATYVSLARATAAFAATAEGQALGITLRLGATMQRIVDAHTKGVWRITGIVSAIAVLYNQQSQSLPGVAAVQGKTPEFTQALNYDPSTGGLTAPLPKTPEVKMPSLLPDFGW
ncbi:hypothetical protein [Streptosporangium sp. NPDC003464]